MKQLSIILLFLIVYSFSLFSCEGIQPIANSNKESPITRQDSGVTSPLPLEVVATSKPTASIDTSCNSNIYEAWENDKTGESGTGKEICEDKPTPTPKKYSLEEQAAIATAFAYMEDKAPTLRVGKVNRLSSENSYIIHFNQFYQGIRVYNSQPSVIIRPNKLPEFFGNYYSNGKLASITPTVTLDEAIAIAVDTLGVEGEYTVQKGTKLIIMAGPSKEKGIDKFVLRWDVYIKANCPRGEWFVRLHAHTGKVIIRTNNDLVQYRDGPCPTPKPMR